MAIGDGGNFWLGLASVVGSVFFFGSMFVPVKRYDCEDGLFVQFIMGIAIFFVGFICQASRGFPTFYPLPLLGGLFWTLANSTAIPLVEVMGMALALLTWNTVSCLMGWATARFGLFGVNPSPPKSDALNYTGLVLLCAGGLLFMFVHKETGRPKAKMTMELAGVFANPVGGDDKPTADEPKTFIATARRYASRHKRIMALLVCVFDGIMYGSRTTPVIYMQDHHEEYPDASNSGVDYVFSYFVGILICTSSIFLIYTAIMKGHPKMHARLVLPSFACGLSWAAAMVLLFVSNDNLSQTIAYPIITVLPGAVAALWSVFYFKEIRGVKNIAVMITAISLTLSGSALIAISKIVAL